MTDIVERLRERASSLRGLGAIAHPDADTDDAAAAEITRLRADVDRLEKLFEAGGQAVKVIGSECARLRAENERLRGALEKDRAAREFTRWVIRNTAWQGGNLDGGDVQEMAEKLGIVERQTATAENRNEWQFIDYCAVGDAFYVFSEWIKPDPGRAALTENANDR